MDNPEAPLDTVDAGDLIAQRLQEAADQPEEESAEEVSEEIEAEAEVEEEAPDTDEEEGEEAAQIETLAELAEALGVEIDSLTGVKHKFNAGGDEVEATLSDLVAGYQKNADYTRKTQELARQREQSEQQIAEQRQQYEAGAHQLAHYLTQVETVLIGTIDSAEMEQLKAANPSEWAVRRAEFQDRIQAVQNFRQQAAQGWQQAQESMQAQLATQLQANRLKEMDALREAIPEWNDELGSSLRTFAGKQYGFSEDEVNAVADHRYFRLALDAQKYHEMKAKADTAAKQVRKAPKMQKPGKPSKPMSVETKQMLNARKKFLASGTVSDAAELLQARLSR